MGTFFSQKPPGEEVLRSIPPGAAFWIQALSLNNLYHSALFRFLMGLLSVNLTVCLSRRYRSYLPSRQLEAALSAPAVLVRPRTEGMADGIASLLKKGGYRQVNRKRGKTFVRGRLRSPLILLGHASLLLIMGSALAGSLWGFVGTKRVPVGDGTTVWFDWKTMSDRSLPFRLEVRNLLYRPYPVALQLRPVRESTGEEGDVIFTHVGGTFLVPGIPGLFVLEEYVPEEKRSRLVWLAEAGNPVEVRPGETIGETGLKLVFLAYAQFQEDQQVYAEVTASRGGTVLVEGQVAVGGPLSVEGISIHLVEYGSDPFGFPYAGLQFSRDPGEGLVWAGCVLFLLSLTGNLLLRQRTVALVEEGEEVRLHLMAFPGREGAREEVLRLLEEPGREADA